MKCIKCQSENVIVHADRKKPPILLGFVLVGFGTGLMFFGIGCIPGALVGLIIGGIIKAVLPYTTTSIAVCQDCGKSWEVKEDVVKQGDKEVKQGDNK